MLYATRGWIKPRQRNTNDFKQMCYNFNDNYTDRLAGLIKACAREYITLAEVKNLLGYLFPDKRKVFYKDGETNLYTPLALSTIKINNVALQIEGIQEAGIYAIKEFFHYCVRYVIALELGLSHILCRKNGKSR